MTGRIAPAPTNTMDRGDHLDENPPVAGQSPLATPRRRERLIRERMLERAA